MQVVYGLTQLEVDADILRPNVSDDGKSQTIKSVAASASTCLTRSASSVRRSIQVTTFKSAQNSYIRSAQVMFLLLSRLVLSSIANDDRILDA